MNVRKSEMDNSKKLLKRPFNTKYRNGETETESTNSSDALKYTAKLIAELCVGEMQNNFMVLFNTVGGGENNFKSI